MLEIGNPGQVLTARARLVIGAIAGILAVAAAFTVLNAIGFRFDPFKLVEKRADRAEAATAVAVADAAGRRLEVEGERLTAQRVDVVVRQAAAAQTATAALSAEAWSASDANLPLPSDRADRLRAHDRELCRLSPALTGCPAPAPAADAGGRRRALPDLPAARPADPG